MAGRGSGIGMSYLGGLGATTTGGPAGGTLNPGIYGKRRGMGSLRTHHWLWILVLLELGLLVFMRYSFRRYHGG